MPRRQASTVDLDPDIFHEAIHRSALAKHVAIVVMEIADECQALRVARKLLQLSSLTKRHFVFEIWREELSLIGRIERVRINSTKADEDEDEGITIDVRGRGRMRVVVCYDARGAQLLGR